MCSINSCDMMKACYWSVGISIVLFLLFNCSNEKTVPGEKIARQYCGSCHAFPNPDLLDKSTWKKNVLPKMSAKLGISSYNGEYIATVTNADTIKTVYNTAISFNDWTKIVQYYTSEAPLKLPGQNRLQVQSYTNLFFVKEAIIKNNKPSTLFIKIDPGNHLVYAGSMYDSSLMIFNQNLQMLQKHKLGGTPVDMCFNNDLALKRDRSGVLTSIGSFYPTNQENGTIEQFYISPDHKMRSGAVIAKDLPRPVQTTILDVNNENEKEYLVCGFGNETGSLFYLQKKDRDLFEKKLLRPLHGAVNSIVEDVNKDRLPDIITLFAQGDEGIFLFTNKGNGAFETKELLRFPPAYGSSHFELQDVNNDGFKDIVYTCGDNFDYSRILKNYHGVYIFLNDGNYRFSQKYFFPINGCYKALARDFDMDGDMDIATISFFPDEKNQPQEAFVYLENKGNLKFTPYTIQQSGRAKWITMDAGDIDGDGDEDIVIGSLAMQDKSETSLNKPIINPTFLLLENQTK
jgi:hypothetical protein